MKWKVSTGSTRVLAYRGPHNLVLAAFSLVMMNLFISELAGQTTSPHGWLCEARSHAPLMVVAWYISKFYEWGDTILLVAAGKPVSSLHYNHHVSTASLVSVNFVSRKVRSSGFDFPAALNAGVHSIMYIYYYNPRAFCSFKRLITCAQILQHAAVLCAILYGLHQYLNYSCDISILGTIAAAFFYSVYLFQFVVFYCSSTDCGITKHSPQRHAGNFAGTCGAPVSLLLGRESAVPPLTTRAALRVALDCDPTDKIVWVAA